MVALLSALFRIEDTSLRVARFAQISINRIRYFRCLYSRALLLQMFWSSMWQSLCLRVYGFPPIYYCFRLSFRIGNTWHRLIYFIYVTKVGYMDQDSEGQVEAQDKRNAVIWNFYVKQKAPGKCKLCNKIIQTPTSSTSGLVRHLKQHPSAEKEYNNLNASAKCRPKVTASCRQLSITESLVKRQKLCTDSRKNEIDRRIAFMMACDFQPFSIVEDYGFRSLVRELEPGYDMPSRTTFSRSVVPKMYQEEKTKLFEEIKSDLNTGVESLCFTSDTWSSRRHESYISFTVHYITETFEMKRHILGNYHFPGSPTSAAIKARLMEAMEEWNLPLTTIPIYIVTDNAKNFSGATNRTTWSHVNCFAHTLQLAIQDAKNEHDLTSLLAKGRSIVGHYRHSNVARERLHKLQEQLEKPVHELLPMVPTRGKHLISIIKFCCYCCW